MTESSSKKRYIDASRVLQEKQRGMVSRFFSHDSPGFMENYTRLLDDYFRESFENSMIGPNMGIDKNPYAMIALGGYGRQEQCAHSDVDILFLFKKELPKKAEALIREIIYPLWDIGLDIGHATRSLKDCINLAAKDFEVLMSLLDARFVCGMSPLYSEMAGRIREKIVFRRGGKIVDWLTEANRERHRVFGDSAYLLEPNLKEGRGGLRDYHALLWLSRVRFNLETPRDLEYHGYLSHEEFQDLERALAFVWKVRSGLHILVRRKYDQLHFAHQVELAERFGYRQGSMQHGVEQFLGELHGHMDVIQQAHLLFFQEAGTPRKRFLFHRKPAAAKLAAGVEVRKQALAFASVKTVIDTPECLVRIFEESVRTGLPLDREARRLIREFRHLMDADAVRRPGAVRALEQVLLEPAAGAHDVLGEMHTTGMLMQFVPELKTVVNQIEYDTYHVYPVDRHLLKTVAAVSRLGLPDDEGRDAFKPSVDKDLCRTLMEELPDRRPLVWSALLHDVGKGTGLAHPEAGERISRSVLARLDYPREMIDTVGFLVRSHQLLPHTATRRDIDNEETALFLAGEVGDLPRLNMLYLLSVADLRATGPKAWNEWTAILMRSLFLKVRHRLSSRGAVSGNTVRALRDKALEVMAAMPSSRDRSDAETLMGVMSSRYLLGTPASEIQDHVDLFRGLGEKPFVWRIDKMPESDTRKVVVLGRDVPGFFSDIAGVLALNRIDVLEAQVRTWRNNTALCIFTVTPPPDPLFEDDRWHRAAQELSAVVSGKLDIRQAIGENASSMPAPAACPLGPPDRIHVDNAASGDFTIIEVHTRDMPGLLYRLTRTLFQCGLDIWSAQIATRSDQVVDVFYVRDFDGRKIASQAEIERVRARIASVLPRAREGPSPDEERPPEAASCNGAA
ncbi:[protein-PII] uridylyltransferase [Desulfococcus sp.]|uniref:[protein-PII] uridylyltransferase n=1 Tax=Desulfococcus sp. TaxID=2025834 RepID=UPI0035931937